MEQQQKHLKAPTKTKSIGSPKFTSDYENETQPLPSKWLRLASKTTRNFRKKPVLDETRRLSLTRPVSPLSPLI
jgi:hypothetical protein